MGEFNTVGLEDIIDAFSRREAATVEAVPKMLKAGADVLIEAQRAEAQAMGLNETGHKSYGRKGRRYGEIRRDIPTVTGKAWKRQKRR